MTSGTDTVVDPVLKAAAQTLFALLSRRVDRGSVTGQGEMFQINQSFLSGREQKQLAEDLKGANRDLFHPEEFPGVEIKDPQYGFCPQEGPFHPFYQAFSEISSEDEPGHGG